jgi:serine/threonine-protein kinase
VSVTLSASPNDPSWVAGRYRVLARIGAGGMGAVFRARDEVLGEDVALKILHASGRRDVERFVREVALARRVTHKNVARTFDLGFDGSSIFLTMELVEGMTLRERMSHGPLAPAEVAGILAHVAVGLASAHEAGVVHRDLKPGNVLLASDGRVVIIDFGIAGVAALPDEREEIVGTLVFMAPEQLRGEPPTPASDVYALGLMAFLMLVGHQAFDGPSAELRARARLVGSAVSLRGAPGVPPHLVSLVDRALALQPGARPTAIEIADEIAPFATHVRSGPRPSSRPAAPGVRVEPTPRTIRVLPFASDGPTLARWDAGASLAEELTDILSRTRGIRVISSAITGARSGASDETVQLRPSGADLYVEGTMREIGERIHVSARLVDAAAGTQIWSGRFQAALGEFVELGGRLAGQVAEALRLELEVRATPERIPDEAAELYLRGRRALRTPAVISVEAMKLFDRVLALAPGFAVAEAARAVAVARAYFFADHDGGDLGDEARRSVARALEVAPRAPDTQLAAGIVSVLVGDLADGIRALERAVELAPTHALALEQLGRLEIESGRNARGAARLELTASLDPLRRSCLLPIARSHALRGRIDQCDRVIARVHEVEGTIVAAEEIALELRVAHWTSDVERARRTREHVVSGTRTHFFDLSARLVVGEDVLDEMEASLSLYFTQPLCPRLRLFLHQIGAEANAQRRPDRALAHLEAAGALPLVDIEWIELCPALDPLRATAAFARVRGVVRERVSKMWGGGS